MIQRRIVVPADPERLWRALTDPDEAGRWLGGELQWTPAEGEPLHFTPAPARGEDEPAREGRVETVEPGRSLRFVWWPEDEGPAQATEVAYELEPLEPTEPTSAPSTILTVEEAPVLPVASCSADGLWTAVDDLQLRLWAASRLPACSLAG